MILQLLLTATLTASIGWYAGHRTARIHTIVIGATPAHDAAAIALNEACCERWWTSCGADHEPTCPSRAHRSAA